jgi:hypothetical protein
MILYWIKSYKLFAILVSSYYRYNNYEYRKPLYSISHLAPMKLISRIASNLRARIVALKKSFTDLYEQKVDIYSVYY